MFLDNISLIFYLDGYIDVECDLPKSTIDFINNIPSRNCYFFTHNCDISRKLIHNKLLEKGLKCEFANIITPNYLLIKYCKTIYNNFSVYPISQSKDFNDYTFTDIPINDSNPSLIFIHTKNITERDYNFLYENKSPIVISSNLCINRTFNCVKCFKNCTLKNIKQDLEDRLIIPDLPPIYNSSLLFKQLNIQPKHTIVITDLLRDDYIQYQRLGCKLILLLTNRTSFDDYIKSPYDADMVIDNFNNLAYFYNLEI